MAEKMIIGENVKATIVEDKLTIEVDLTERLRRSNSGKNILIATTGGNAKVMSGDGTQVSIGINIFTK